MVEEASRAGLPARLARRGQRTVWADVRHRWRIGLNMDVPSGADDWGVGDVFMAVVFIAIAMACGTM